ncbi:unnamed protein product [Miscanthus lutarioriparius]|uniref:Uncharacterized protein n=1 Tax=Miscanthus lutarioriparius TaxID=422564 RepID=A0A811SK01_9POAL|nr:unnamed protein product [Miscanthus lutarioriparius]
MDCSSDESSELSETDIDDYAEKSYLDLKAGKFVARLGSDRFRCPFCPGKKKQDYRYNELLQHAVGVGASNCAAKVKANHQALAKLLKEDHADAAATLPPRQAIALRGGGILMKQLADFKPVQVTAVYGDNGYTGYAIVLFTKDWIGFKNAFSIPQLFQVTTLGETGLKEAKQHVKYVFGWLAKEEDYKSDDPVGRFLSSNGDLKTVSELEQEMSSKTDNLIANLTQQITAKSKYLQELECKCNQMNLSFRKSWKKVICCTNVIMKNADQNDSLNMARIEQQKADQRALQLLEKHKKDKEDALNKILQLERQVDEKQKLELDIEQLKGKLEVVKHMEGEGVDVKKRSEELAAELNERIEEMEDLEALNQTLVVKERMTNYEIQDAKKELITVLVSNIGIKRMGELDEKPFVLSCKQRYGEDAEMKAAEFVSLWQEHLKDPNWHPFKIVTTGSTTEQILNDKDEKLVGLKKQLTRRSTRL